MDGLELTPWTVVPLLITIAALMVTLVRVGAALADRRALDRATAAGLIDDHPVTRRVVGSGLRREGVRVYKHVLTIGGAASGFTAMVRSENYVLILTWAFAAIAVGLMLNSLFDHWLQRFAMNHLSQERRREQQGR